MSYIALARKYRPKNFAELIGQGILVNTLSNAIKENRVHHAFLLTGIRGVGKTTTARIIAKNLNCTGADGTGKETDEPCDVCVNCTSITAGNHPDVVEFDAASNTGIEDVKLIISNTHYTPVLGRKKVFIIDEIHMLSTKAFNALLKTLEEPPENTIFIFATTESRKVPITILSRCQKFFLRALKTPEIALHLSDIASKEGYKIEAEALEVLAEKACGSMRDALSLLDQAILNSSILGEDKTNISFENIKEMLKIPSKEESLKLFNSVLQGSMTETLAILEDLTKTGLEELEVVYDLLEIVATKTKAEALGKAELGMPALIRFYQILNKGVEEIKFAENKQQALEVLIIKLCYSWGLPSPMEVIERMKEKDINSALSMFEGAKMIEG